MISINYMCSILVALCLSICCSGYCQRPEIFNMYDTLQTIAGKGKIKDKELNGWKKSYEGGMATEVELSRPHMAMADSHGNIFVADKFGNAIRKITPEGKIYTSCGQTTSSESDFEKSKLVQPNGLWVTKGGAVYILDYKNSSVKKVTPEGVLKVVFIDEDGIKAGRGICVSENEKEVYYAAGTEVRVYNKDEGISVYAKGFTELANIILDKNKELVVTDKKANSVIRIHKDGTKEVIAGNGYETGGGNGYKALETGLYGVCGIWFNDDNSYFLATHQGSQIWFVDTDGIIYLFLDGAKNHVHDGDNEHYLSKGKKISEPRSVTADYQGNIIIVENDHGYVRRIKRKNN